MRRSTIRAAEVNAEHVFLSPYRCRDCGDRFWVVGRNTYLFAIAIGFAMLTGAMVWSLWMLANKLGPGSTATGPIPPPSPELIKLAEDNDPAAQYEVARAHANAEGDKKNEKEALKWLERSARHGNTQAQYELAIVLREGQGTIQDWEGARYWMIKAAKGGHPQAQYDLGLMYRSGAGIDADNVQAYIWLNLAAAQGVPGAAPLRDATLSRLSSAEVTDAQKESRRLSERTDTRPAGAR